jgi:hypothetical protein
LLSSLARAGIKGLFPKRFAVISSRTGNMTLRKQAPTPPSKSKSELRRGGTSNHSIGIEETVTDVTKQKTSKFQEITVREEAPETASHLTADQPKEQRVDDPSKNEEVVIIVMGVTGAGKSSFISLLTDQAVGIGHDLESRMPVHLRPSSPVDSKQIPVTLHCTAIFGKEDPLSS